MSILTDVYKISSPTSSDFYVQEDPYIDYINSNKLVDVVEKIFMFDIDLLSIEDNAITNIFWNFGDPFCDPSDNELVVHHITDSVVSHVYTQAGTYKVHTIVTVDGVLFHLEKSFTLIADGEIVYFDPEIVIFNSTTFVPSTTIDVQVEGIYSTHYIITDTDTPPSTDDINWSTTPPTTYTV